MVYREKREWRMGHAGVCRFLILALFDPASPEDFGERLGRAFGPSRCSWVLRPRAGLRDSPLLN